MLRMLLVSAGLLLSVPASASAVPFGELPARAVPGGVSCLHATGEAGVLAHDRGFDRAFPGQTALLRADATGLHAGAAVPARPYGSCTELDLRPSGAGIAAFYFADEPGESGVRVVLRQGGTWGAPAEVLGAPGQTVVDSVAAGISDAGAALVAGAIEGEQGFAVTATRRAPGGGFGPAETLARAGEVVGTLRVQAGMTAAGESVVAWSLRRRERAARELWATYAAPGAAFQSPVRIGAPRGPVVLAVGEGGHALLAFTADKRMHVAERAPGAGFGPVQVVGVADDPLLVFPAAAVRADGAAVVGWTDYLDGAVRAVTRPGTRPFGAQVQLARRVPLGFDRALVDGAVNPGFRDADSDFDDQFQLTGATFAGERAVLAWATQTRRGGVYTMAPSVATLPTAGGRPEVHPIGNGLRTVPVVSPVVLGDGRPAIAWAEETALHLAVEGAADAADPPAPSVRIGAPKRRLLGAGESLRLPVTCSAACDVRASAAFGAFDGTAELSLPRAGSGTLRLGPDARPIARLDGKPVPIHVRSGAPGTRHPQSRTLMVRLRRKPAPPLPRVRAARARRAGDDVVVTWRTDRDAGHDNFYVYATAEPHGDALGAAEATGSKRRFRARVRDVAAARLVTILTGGTSAGVIRSTTVEIK